MGKKFLIGVCTLAMLLGVSPVFAESFSGNIPGDPLPSFEDFQQNNQAQNGFSCRVEGTNRLQSNTENIITARVEYTSSAALRDVSYSFDAYGDLGAIISLSGNINLDPPEGDAQIAASGETTVLVPFNITQNADIVIEARIGNTQCTPKTFTPVEVRNFGFGNLINVLNFNPQITPNNNLNLDALQNGEAVENNDQPAVEANPVLDAVVNGNPDPTQDLEANISPNNNLNLDALQNGQAVGNNNDQQQVVLNPQCKIISEARKNTQTFRVFAAVSYEQFPVGEYPYVLVAGMPDGSKLTERSGTVRVDAEGNGILLNDESSFQFVFDRSSEDQQIVINGHIAGVVCASAFFVDPGVEPEVVGQEAAENNNNSGAGNLAGREAQSQEKKEERVLPEGVSSEDVLLLESLQVVDQDMEGSSVNEKKESLGDEDQNWQIIILVVLGLIIIGLLGANIMKKNPVTKV